MILQGRYRLVGDLGQGGMGHVYLAEDKRILGRQVAIKENSPPPDDERYPDSTAKQQQFINEVRVLAQLDHPHLPKVSDYFTENGRDYLVMDYIEGENLAQMLWRMGAPLPEEAVLRWADQILDALVYLHGHAPQPIIHRDIKPANIRLTPQGKVKLVDFGLVKLLDVNRPHTQTGSRGLGSAPYAPVEQYSDIPTDGRTDIYALGATLYHLLTNQLPPSSHKRMFESHPLRSVREINSRLSVNTEHVIARAMALRPEERYQSALEMRHALSGVAAEPSSHYILPTSPSHPSSTVYISSSTSKWPSWFLILLMSAVVLILLLIGGLMGQLWLASDTAESESLPPTLVAEVVITTVATDIPSPIPPTLTRIPPSSSPVPSATQLPTATRRPTSASGLVADNRPSHTPEPILLLWDDFLAPDLDSSLWQQANTAGSLTIQGGILQMESTGPAYPYLYSQQNPFPLTRDFQVDIRFRYPDIRDCGVGIFLATERVPVGLDHEATARFQQEAEENGMTLGIWQDRAQPLQIWFRAGSERIDSEIAERDSAWHKMQVTYIAEQYTIYMDDIQRYRSSPTDFRPQLLWMGHPANLGTDCLWSGLEVASIKVQAWR